MKIVIAKNTWLADSGLRLDASFHLSDSIQIRHLFKSVPYELTTIRKQAEKIYSGNIFKRVYVKNPEKGIPYITGSDMIKQDIDSGKYISKKQANDLKSLMLKRDWILVSCSGTLGNTVYTNEIFNNRIGTHDLIRIIPNNKDVLQGFLYAYLSSKYGYSLLTQSSYGGVVKHIEPEHIENIPVPIFPEDNQLEIHNLIVESAELRVEANKVLKVVEILFHDFLKIKPHIQNKYQIGSRKISEIQNSFQVRLDAPAFINNGVKLIESLSKDFDFVHLGTLDVNIRRPGIFKRVYVDKGGLPYIKGSELALCNPFTNCVYLSKTKTPFLDELKLKQNQILITCAGSVGSVRLITKEFEDLNSIGSQDIIRIESNDKLFTSEYIFAYLRLPVVFFFFFYLI
jgi:restriction endonuclease S subunit